MGCGSLRCLVNPLGRGVNRHVKTQTPSLSGLQTGGLSSVDRELPRVCNLSPGVKSLKVDVAAVQGELFASFCLAMLTGVLCIYIVLVLTS